MRSLCSLHRCGARARIQRIIPRFSLRSFLFDGRVARDSYVRTPLCPECVQRTITESVFSSPPSHEDLFVTCQRERRLEISAERERERHRGSTERRKRGEKGDWAPRAPYSENSKIHMDDPAPVGVAISRPLSPLSHSLWRRRRFCVFPTGEETRLCKKRGMLALSMPLVLARNRLDFIATFFRRFFRGFLIFLQTSQSLRSYRRHQRDLALMQIY